MPRPTWLFLPDPRTSQDNPRNPAGVLLEAMPVYEYLCRTCDSRFETRRAMSDAGAPIACPEGHPDTTRLLSVFAAVGRSTAGPAPAPAARPAGGCGAGCACAH